MTLQRVCVFCGSSPGRDPRYVEAGRLLGQRLLAGKLGLVYGGASIGVMGAVADAVLEGGGEVIGVIPEALAVKEVAHAGLTQLLVVGSMHERKALMARHADAFVALPGGFGTLEELFEVLTWAQLGLHAKPCGLLNVNGYFDALLAFVDRAVDEGFLRPQHRDLLVIGREPQALLDRLASYQPHPERKWIRTGEE